MILRERVFYAVTVGLMVLLAGVFVYLLCRALEMLMGAG
ncbi:MAG: hypothetical protein A4E30_00289 [Methanomassiliicoccales archaeon PtaB.Bin215]|nr:MAG: hypothetical protein A4E30_00289 [Methanomassiliicoccales archaeon PtaB.Bin215]